MDGDNVEEDGVVIAEIKDEEAVSSADPEGGGAGGPDPPPLGKLQKYRIP